MLSARQDDRRISVRTYHLPPLADEAPPAVSVRVVYACPHCDQSLRIRPEYFGATLACKHCEHLFRPSLAQAISATSRRVAGRQRA